MEAEFQKLYTEAGEKLRGDHSIVPWDVYPRPHMKRAEWLSLNGFWDFETESGDRGKVRVPFPVESPLSGFVPNNDLGRIAYGEKLYYRRSFTVPESWRGKRVLLHYCASRMSLSKINGSTAVDLMDGRADAYNPVCTDITKLLAPGENELEITCVNDLDPKYPYGKQRIERGGMWYTPCSGLWQTVWLEPVPEKHIWDITCRSDDKGVTIIVSGIEKGTVFCEGEKFKLEHGLCRIEPRTPRLWSPEEPNLYEFTVRAGEDEVQSYFALRTIETKTINGVPRLCLNGKPYFFNGLLDQGYFSDGLWTPAEPQEYERDILKMKSLGFNMLRKHIKIEPELFYYFCDKLGMAVFQDMVNNGKYSFFRDTVLPTLGFQSIPDGHINRDKETREVFTSRMVGTAKALSFHPSIVYWTVFNEGWGQFEADRMYGLLKEADTARIIDSTSGWFHRKKTDVDSLHIYFKRLRLGKRREKPQVISEFGGYVWKDEGHSFNPNKTYGYKILRSREEFVKDLRRLYQEELLPLIPQGLCAAVYTQVSDVEDETNGLLTFDRRVMKVQPEEFSDISEAIKKALAE